MKVLDRHVVTVAERIKAKLICEKEYNLVQGNGKAPVVRDTGPKITKKTGNGFSKGEKDLYREYGQIQNRFEQTKKAEMEATRKFFETKTYEGIPVPSKKQENKDYFGRNTEDKLVEWEKNQVLELW